MVDALCGAEWRALEGTGAFQVDLGAALFRSIVSLGVIEMPEDFSAQDISHFEKAFADAVAKACPTWPESDLDDEAADNALSSAFDATLLAAHADGRHHLLDPDDFDFGASGDAWRSASDQAHLAALGSPLLRLIAPTRGAEVLGRRPFVTSDLAETATFLADWTTAWCLPRSHISKELACSSLQVWLSPGATDTDAAIRQMARDTFLARAVRYVALRMAA